MDPDFCNYIEFKLDWDGINTGCIGFADPRNHNNECNEIFGTLYSYSYCLEDGKWLQNVTKDVKDDCDLVW